MISAVKALPTESQALTAGLQETQDESVQQNQGMLNRLELIEKQITEQELQLSKLLDLYLSGDFPREVLTERKARLEEHIANLRNEHEKTRKMIEKVALTDRQIDEIQLFCDGVRDRLDTTDFDEKRQLFEMFDVRGTLAVENEEKVVHASCLISPQPVSLALTSLWRSNHNRPQYLVAARLVIPTYGGFSSSSVHKNSYTPISMEALNINKP